ncbi:hypothetical protein BJX96DRAFT_188197 [Aspergillus floccosus]
MSVPIQMIHIHYRGKRLSLLDSDDTTPLYTVTVCRHTPQMQLVRLPRDSNPNAGGDTDNERGICTAAFEKLSMNVTLSIYDQPVMLRRLDIFSRTYAFESTTLAGTALHWEADGALTGDFKLVNQQNCQVLARFHNKVFSVTEVGSFEMVGLLPERLNEEIVISGLAVLVMVQSLNLASMVLMGTP